MAHRPANIDDARTRREEAAVRHQDPHGAQPARQADQDEPRAWPSSDRQKLETTVSRVQQGQPEPPIEPVVKPPSDTGTRLAGEVASDLPAPGYPYSEQALTAWFRRSYGRPPYARELGALMNAMARRDATSPHEGPEPDPHGWETKPSAAPATRR